MSTTKNIVRNFQQLEVFLLYADVRNEMYEAT